MKHSTNLLLVISFFAITTALYAVGEVKLNTNFTVESDGTIVSTGAATTWDDIMVFPDATTRSSSVPPVMDRFMRNSGNTSQGVCLWGFSPTTEQEVYFTLQIPHSYKVGTTLYPHVHWTTTTATPTTTNVYWGLEYTIMKFGGTYGYTSTTTGHTVAGILGVPTGTAQHLITPLDPIVSGSAPNDIGISTILVCRLYRIAADPGDTFTAITWLLGFDIHYEKDTQGSREEFFK